MSHIPYDIRHVPHINESCPSYQWVMSHVSMSNVPHTVWYKTCPTYQWIMSLISMSHVPRINESWPTYQWVLSHISMNHVPRTNESCPTNQWVMSHTSMSHVPRRNAPCPTSWMKRDMSHVSICALLISNSVTRHFNKQLISPQEIIINAFLTTFPFDWCCFYYFVRNSPVAVLESLCTRKYINNLSLSTTYSVHTLFFSTPYFSDLWHLWHFYVFSAF